MNQLERFDIDDVRSFDIKDYALKVISHWKLFLGMLLLGLIIAFFINRRKPRIYSLNSIITVKEEQNPLFTSSTNIAFNWGGPSDKVETIITILKSRTHNEKVVKKLKYYIQYLRQGPYRLEDAYGKVPFEIELDSGSYNIIGVPLKLEFFEDNQVELSADFDKTDYQLMNYEDHIIEGFSTNEKDYHAKYDISQKITSPFFDFRIVTYDLQKNLVGNTYYLLFNSFNGTVGQYRSINARTKTKGTSLIELELKGTNKKKIQDYINTTVEVLDHDQREQKVEYARRTKQYIDTVFEDASRNLRDIEKDLGDYKRKNNVYDLSAQGGALLSEVTSLDRMEQDTQDRLQYYNNLENYILSNIEISDDIPVPVNVALEDANITKNIGELVELSKQKRNLEQTVTPNFPTLKNINDRIGTTRNVILENLSNLKKATQTNLDNVKRRIGSYNSRLNTLPKKEQGLIKFERNYNLTAANYEYLKQKQYEAGTAIAANVSDVKILDKAKDVGQSPVSPRPMFNYLIAAMLSFGIPFLFILVKEALNTKILTVEELEKLFEIPVLGVIGRGNIDNYLAVFNKPKSSLAESFRALRSNIQFLFKKNTSSKTIVITSSVSGEGKTLTSINMATVFAMSDKKTVLIGLDLRKPKLHNDFNISNDLGVVNFLIGQKEIPEIIQQSQIPNLDIITSGPIPPNPSELLLSSQTSDLMSYLKENYDYIVIDTPPVGLVADAIELFNFADAVMYIVRQNYTHRGMPKMIDDKYRNGEVKNISFVLNDFSVKNNYGYGYGGYNYGYGYGGGYGKYGNGYHVGEKSSWWKKIFKM